VSESLGRRVTAEFIGTAFLLAAIVGSGIMAESLSPDPGLQLLQNALATAGALTAIILALGSVSGAHLNPAVTLADRAFGGLTNRETAGYIAAQVTGGVVGVVIANLMFDLPAVTWSTTARSGSNLWLAETVATLGLLLVIFGLVRAGRGPVVAFAVGGYIAGAYYFTSSTSFANPAVSIARMFSDSFAGIEPTSVAGFVIAELVGTLLAVAVMGVLFPTIEQVADRVVMPHEARQPAPTTQRR
jgi:glycerol uptake facilitator-like aquaporin